MNSEPYHILLFGPPGAGKSTQSELLAREWNVAALSTGELLREQVAAGTEIGNRVREILARGELVDDALMIEILRGWLAAIPPDKGFLLDGFPRTIPQAHALDELLDALHRPLTAVINLQLSLSEAVARLGGRRTCHGNGPDEIIHIDDEAAVERCIARGGLLVQRPDDLPKVIVRRFNVYQAETAPLLDFYRPRGIERTVNASGSPAQIARRIVKAVRELLAGRN